MNYMFGDLNLFNYFFICLLKINLGEVVALNIDTLILIFRGIMLPFFREPIFSKTADIENAT